MKRYDACLLLSTGYDGKMTATNADNFDQSFGKRLATARKSAGHSQRAFADLLSQRGVSLDSAALSRIETGSRAPKLEEAVVMAHALSIRLDELLPPTDSSDEFAYARHHAIRAIDDAMYKITSVAGRLEYLAVVDDLALAAGTTNQAFDVAEWSRELISSLALAEERRVTPHTRERAEQIRAALREFAAAVVRDPSSDAIWTSEADAHGDDQAG